MSGVMSGPGGFGGRDSKVNNHFSEIIDFLM